MKKNHIELHISHGLIKTKHRNLCEGKYFVAMGTEFINGIYYVESQLSKSTEIQHVDI